MTEEDKMAAVKCKKFMPNIFNKSKCQHCFKPKELHSVEALESNRICRKISKCGYLFVAPDSFDFSSPLDKSRRWQRRFCVLYDDGALSYSVDENVNTVPQGEIDMNVCTDVFDAENTTSHEFSICIKTPSSTTYMKGTGKEEVTRWHDVLVMYPRSTKTKHRRSPSNNPPSSRPASVSETTTTSQIKNSKDPRAVRYPLSKSVSLPQACGPGEIDDENEADDLDDCLSISMDRHTTHQTGSHPHLPAAEETKHPTKPISDHPSGITYRGIRSLKHKHDKVYSEGLRKSNSWGDLSPSNGTAPDKVILVTELRPRSWSRGSLDDKSVRQMPDASLDLVTTTTPATTTITTTTRSTLPESSTTPITTTPSTPQTSSRTANRSRDIISTPLAHMTSTPISDVNSIFRSRSPTSCLLLNGRSKNETDERKMAMSGDFSNCLENPNPNPPADMAGGDHTHSHSRKDNTLTDLSYMKKGWLVMQDTPEKDWTKHWFVLSGGCLRYYEDSRNESPSLMEGEIELTNCQEISELSVSRNYGFVIKMDHKDYVLSAITSMIRTNWIHAIQKCIKHIKNCNLSRESTPPQEVSPTKSGHGTRKSTVPLVNGSCSRRTGERYHTHTGALTVPTRSDTGSGGGPGHSPLSPAPSVNGIQNSNPSRSVRSAENDHVRMRRRRLTVDSVPSSQISIQDDKQRQAANKSFRRTDRVPSMDDMMEEDVSDAAQELSVAEQQELDHVEHNIRRIHRKSISDSIQLSKPQHFDKFESGCSPLDNHSVCSPASGHKETPRTSHRHNDEGGYSDLNLSSINFSPHDLADNDDGAQYPCAPSAKVKEKSLSKSPRSRSPPSTPGKLEAFIDSFMQQNLESHPDDPSGASDSIERKWQQVEGRTLPDSSGNGREGAVIDLLETEVDSLKNELDRTRRQLSTSQGAIAQLRTKLRTTNSVDKEYLDDVEADQTRCLAQIEDMQQKMDQSACDYQQQLQQQEDKKTKVCQQVEQLKSELEAQKILATEKQEKHSSTTIKLKVAMSELAHLETALQESAEEMRQEQKHSQEAVSELEQLLDTKECLILHMEQEGSKHVEKINELQSKLEDRSERLDGHSEEVECMQRDLKEKRQEIAGLCEERRMLHKQLREQDEGMARDTREHQAKVKSMEEQFYREKQQMESQFQHLQHRLEQLTKQSNMSDSLNADMTDILREKDEMIAQLEEKQIETDARLEELKKELNLEIEENSNVQQGADESMAQMYELKQKVHSLQYDMKQLDEDYKTVTQENADVVRKVKTKITENELLAKDLERVEAKLVTIEKNNNKLSGENESMKKEFYISQAESGNHTQQILKYNQNVESLQQQLEESRCDNSTLKTSLLVAQNAASQKVDMSVLQKLGEKYQKSANEIERLNEKIMSLTEENSKLRSSEKKLSEAEEHVAHLKDMIDELQQCVLDAEDIGEKYHHSEEQIANMAAEMRLAEKQHKEIIQSLQKEVELKTKGLEQVVGNELLVSELQEAQKKAHLLQQKMEEDQQWFQSHMEEKFRELQHSQQEKDELVGNLEQLELSLSEQKALVDVLESTSNLDVVSVSSVTSSPCDMSYNTVPEIYEELKEKYNKINFELKQKKKDLQELQVEFGEVSVQKCSLEQQVKNFAAGQDHASQSGRVNELFNKLAAAEKRIKRYERRRSSLPDAMQMVDVALQTDSEMSDTSHHSADNVVQELSNKVVTLQQQHANFAKDNEHLTNSLLDQRSLQMDLSQLTEDKKHLEEQLEQQKASNREYGSDKEVETNNIEKLKELQYKVNSIQALLMDCNSKICDLLENGESDNSSNISQDIKLKEASTSLEKALGLVTNTRSIQCVQADTKLQLFAEKLALEAVLLGEMAYMVRDEEVRADVQRKHFLEQTETAHSRVLHLEHCLHGSTPKQTAAAVSDIHPKNLELYASLLADKMLLQGQLASLMEESLMGNKDHITELPITCDNDTQNLAQIVLSKAHIDELHLNSSHFTDIGKQISTSPAVTHALVHAEVAYVLNKVRDSYQGSYCSEQDRLKLLESEISSIYQRLLLKEEQVQSQFVAYSAALVDKLSKEILALEASTSGQFSRNLIQKELDHLCRRYCAHHGVDLLNLSITPSDKPLVHTVASLLYKLVVDTVDRLEDCTQKLASRDLKQYVGSLQLKDRLLMKLADLLAQVAVVKGSMSRLKEQAVEQGMAPQLTSQTSARRRSSLGVTPMQHRISDKDRELAANLASDAAAKFDLASFLVNNTENVKSRNGINSVSSLDKQTLSAATIKEQIAQLALQLVDTDLETVPHRGPQGYAEHTAQEAVFQAQLSYVVHILHMRHQQELLDVRLELESSSVVSQALQDQEVADLQDEIQTLESHLRKKGSQLTVKEDDTLKRIAEIESDLQRQENNFQREKEALKNGYDIRIRSLQADLEAVHVDLEKLQQETDAHVFSYESKISAGELKLRDQREEMEVAHSEFDEERCSLLAETEELRVQVQLLQSPLTEVGGIEKTDKTDMQDVSELESSMLGLKEQMEQERDNHRHELEKLQSELQHDVSSGSEMVLHTRIQQLEEQIQNIQLDYEQELAVQKSAYRRELSRNNNDSLQLLAAAESKNIHIDEDTIRRKYMKEIDRIKAIYDRGFSTIEKSHQRVLMEMRQQHKKELELLRQDKDDVLAEETQATHAALDAMRKAHDAELQRERHKFLDLINKTYSQTDVESLQRQHEEDLELIQSEMQQVSEQFSIKCLECASLEEHLEMLTRSLCECRKRNQDLLARNEELTTQLKHEIEKLNRMVRKVKAGGDPLSPICREPEIPEVSELKVALLVKDTEVMQLNDERSLLHSQLHATQQDLHVAQQERDQFNNQHHADTLKLEQQLEDMQVQLDAYEQVFPPGDNNDARGGHLGSENSIHQDLARPSTTSSVTDSVFEEVPTSTSKGQMLASGPNGPSGDMDDSSQGSSGGRQLPQVSSEARNIKKALWRQKQPQRARSNPGLVGTQLSIALAQASPDGSAAQSLLPGQPAQLLSRQQYFGLVEFQHGIHKPVIK